jgi:MATE family multidrug resistance protein
VLQLTHLSFLPAHALAEAASVMVGNAVGAGRLELVPLVARRALVMGVAYTAGCTVVFAVAARPLALLLGGGDDPALLSVATTLIYISAAFLVADAANVIARGVLRGAGDVRYAAVIGVCTAWCMTPPTAWLLWRVAGWGAAGGWIGLTGEILVGALILWWRIQSGRWRDAAVASRRQVRGEAPSSPEVPDDVATPAPADRVPALSSCEVG